MGPFADKQTWPAQPPPGDSHLDVAESDVSTGMTEVLLEIEELEAGYDEALVLRGVSLRVGADQIVSIIGPNGAGKSTLLKAVYGLVRPRAGRVLFAGEEVTGTRPDRLTRRGLNLVPQTDNV